MDALEKLTVSESADLTAAMKSLKDSGRGIVVVTDGDSRVTGVLTDGDIRAALLEREDLHAPVIEYMTRDFTYVCEGTPKEQTLKLLDSRVHAIPVLDHRGRLVTIVSTGYMETLGATYSRAKAPVRISLAGGGTDFTNHFMEHGGVSLSATISMHSHAVLEKRADKAIRIYSHDRTQALEIPDPPAIRYDGSLDLIKAGVKVMRPKFGFELWVSCDFPEGSGLGGSAALLASVIGCLNEFRENKFDAYAIAEHAFEAERIELDIKGGWQDQYSTVFGGFNFIEFNKARNTVTPLRLQPDTVSELEERFLLCYTGAPHLSEMIQADNYSRDRSDADALAFADGLKAIAYEMRAHLLRGKLADFGRMLDETWKLKKRFNERVTDNNLDAIYDAALAAGAEGGRLLGTGGGGYFLFFVKPFERYSLAAALEQKGFKTQSVVFDEKGLQSWTARP